MCRWSPRAASSTDAGLAAALALGADGIWVGTRFIATPEARGVPGYKDALLRTHEDDTVVTRAYTGKTCRVIANRYTAGYEDGDRRGRALPRADLPLDAGRAPTTWAATSPRPASTPTASSCPAGQGVGAIDALVPAADLVRQIVDDAERVLAKLRG